MFRPAPWVLSCAAVAIAACGSSAKPKTTCSGICTAAHWTRLDPLAGLPGGPGWVDGSLTAAHFSDPWNLVGDGQGHLYVEDGETIRVVDVKAGTVSTLAGVYGKVGTADGVGAAAMFNTPSGIVLTSGQLYLTDTENHTIRKVDLASATVTTVAGAARQPGAVDAAGADARFQEPEGLGLDAAGNLIIADTDNNTIRKMSLATGVVTTLAGTAGAAGSADGVGAAALFDKPKALTLDAAGNAFVVDALNQSIRKIDLSSGAVSTLAAFDSLPQGVCVDGTDVLVSLASHVVVRVAPDGTVSPVGGSKGVAGFVDGAGADARFDYPAGMWNDGNGTVYLADEKNAVIRTIALAGPSVETFAGARSVGSSDGVASLARFSGPLGLAADDAVAYVADTGNATLRKIVLATGAVTTLAGSVGRTGDSDGVGPAALFSLPEGIALDAAAQQLYVVDAQNRDVRQVDVATGAVTALAVSVAAGDSFGGFQTASGAALEGGKLYVTDYGNQVVVAIDLKTHVLSTLAGTPLTPGGDDGVGAKASFYGPLGIAGDGRGHLFVADNLNHTLRAIDVATGAVSTLAGQMQIQGSDDGTGSNARFRFPTGVAADGLGNVFVSDSNNTIRHVVASTGAVTTVVGNLQGAGVMLGPLPAQLTQPSAIALTATGDLLIVSENAVLVAR
ncbi:MAG TPA: hypothetical protein VKU41_14660 [Polyangiaceae bacterium]|nr:hypothetical protein [Polyangiaceae bacterium]